MQPAKHQIGVLTRKLGHVSKRRSHHELAAFAKTDAFAQGLLALSPDHRLAVLASHARAWARCEARAPMVTPTKARVSWLGNDLLLARLRKLAPLYSSDADLAHALGQGLSASQVQRARLRFVGKWTPADAQATVNEASQIVEAA